MEKIKHTELPWREDEMNTMSIIDNGPDRFDSLILQTNGKSREQALANKQFVLTACNHHYLLVEALKEAVLQIEYLHQKFGETGTGNSVVSRSNALISSLEQK